MASDSFPAEGRENAIIDVAIDRPTGRGALGIVFDNALFFAVVVGVMQLGWRLGLDRVIVVAGGLLVALLLVPIVVMVRGRLAVRRAVQRCGILLLSLRSGLPSAFAVQLADALRGFVKHEMLDVLMHIFARVGLRGTTIRIGMPAAMRTIRPIVESFEPVPINHLQRWELEDAVAPSAETNSAFAAKLSPTAGRDGSVRIGAAGGWVTRFLQGPWSSAALSALFVVPAALLAWRTGRVTFSFVVFAGWFALSLWRALRSGPQLENDFGEAFVVPGGVVVRRPWARRKASSETQAEPGSDGLQLHLFTRRQSVLCMDQRALARWRVFIADGQSTFDATMDQLEAERLLQAWMSPVETPTLDRLTDLR